MKRERDDMKARLEAERIRYKNELPTWQQARAIRGQRSLPQLHSGRSQGQGRVRPSSAAQWSSRSRTSAARQPRPQSSGWRSSGAGGGAGAGAGASARASARPSTGRTGARLAKLEHSLRMMQEDRKVPSRSLQRVSNETSSCTCV